MPWMRDLSKDPRLCFAGGEEEAGLPPAPAAEAAG